MNLRLSSNHDLDLLDRRPETHDEFTILFQPRLKLPQLRPSRPSDPQADTQLPLLLRQKALAFTPFRPQQQHGRSGRGGSSGPQRPLLAARRRRALHCAKTATDHIISRGSTHCAERTQNQSIHCLSFCVFLFRFLIFGPRSSVPSLFRSSVFGPRSALPCRSHRAPRAAGALHRRAPADDCQSLGRSQCACRVPLASWSLACMVRLEREPVPRFPGHAVGPKWPKIRQRPGAVFIIYLPEICPVWVLEGILAGFVWHHETAL